MLVEEEDDVRLPVDVVHHHALDNKTIWTHGESTPRLVLSSSSHAIHGEGDLHV